MSIHITYWRLNYTERNRHLDTKITPKHCDDLNEAAVHGVYEAVLHELLRQQQRRVRGPRDEAVQLTVHVVLHVTGVSTFHTFTFTGGCYNTL